MLRTSPRLARRPRVALEAFEDRLPVSESIGTALALSALAGVAAVVIRRDTPAPSPASTSPARPAQGPSTGPTGSGGATPGTTSVEALVIVAGAPSSAVPGGHDLIS